MRHVREMLVTVEINIEDESVVRRVVENEDNWQGTYYRMKSEDDVLDHLAYNAVANGVDHVSRLDGWADLPPEAARMRILDVEPW